MRGAPIAALANALENYNDKHKIQTLSMHGNDLFGVMESLCFPQNLRVLDLSGNDLYGLSGPLLRCMPPLASHLYLHNNHFCDRGRFAWDALPNGLQTLYIYNNHFYGKIDWLRLTQHHNLISLTVPLRMAKASMDDMPNGWIRTEFDDAVQFVVTWHRETWRR